MKIKKYLWVLFFSFTAFSWAQTIEVSGTVIDGSNNFPLPGANVIVKNTTNGTQTDFDGNFSLEASRGDILVVSFLGYVTQEVPATDSPIQVTLMEDSETLDQVVVVGYGTQSKRDITGSVSIIDDEAFDDRPNTQVGALIQGKAPGVQVVSGSGKPSSGLNIRIRGTNSINASSEPLYVVDGVPTNDTRSLNPADIESISVLKDASSAAIYGAQGANGVVLITTRKGTSEKPRLTFDTYVGVSQVWNTLPVLNSEQYRDLMTEMGRNTDWSRYTENTDWQKVIFGDGLSSNYQLGMSGKSNGTSYYVSGGYTKQEGAVRSSEMERYNFKINLSQEVTEWLEIGTNIAYTHYSDVDVTDNQSINSGGVLLGVLSTPPNIGIYNPDGTFTSNPFQDWENPVASTDGSQREYVNQRLLGNIYAEISFLEDFTFKTNIGTDYSSANYDYFLDPFRTSYGRAMKGIGRYNTNLTNFYIFDNTLSYEKEIGRHNLKALVGSVFQKYRWEDSSMERRNFAGDKITTPNAGSELIAATATKAEKANASYLARVNYEFDERYLLTANFRADGSSNFGPKERWGYFPSFSAGWRISEESFMRDQETINDMKLRAGWGLVGNDQVGNYAYYGRVGSGGNYPIGGVVLPGTYPASIANETLKWEESEQINIGLDVALFNRRIRFSADAYQKDTRDLLLNAPLPRSTGFNSAIQNIGQLRNKGLEFQLTTVNTQGEFNWESDFNISFNRNEVIDIVGQQMFAGGVAGRGEVSLVREGEPLGTFYGYLWGGVDPETGMAYYLDSEGETTFSPSADDRTIIGDANPDFQYGFTNNLSYKGFGLSVFLQGSQGNDIFNATRIETEGMTDSKNQSRAVLDRWREPGDITDIPRTSEGNTDNSRLSTRFVEDGSYLRMKALTLSYGLPKTFLESINLDAVKLYATGENLFTLTDYSGFDPEVNAFGGSNTAMGVDYGTYPQTRNLILGLNVTF
ncbi:SusC/RagA family TonB-linked outer membrane protein [Salegentibacter flavus]|uniref:TonB-linked outer membrane protein, SusC/RagA family n=1 Tax=Salegentibacter flavus TaxID=287099 RepID=A0A1I4ZHT8_9FLAO|nr:TonB-dependent receptor [Salegentibacter flavus]SFN49717.1 TonB-linked outer membrane protein, SusC/RagA family [Salegentibacter flavus]